MTSVNVNMNINQFYVNCRSAKMESRNFLILIFLNTLVIFTHGFGFKGERQALPLTPEDCMRPPTTRHDRGCCKLPKERIWGDLRQSLELCLRKMNTEPKPMRQEMADDGGSSEGSGVITSTEIPGELASVPSASPSTHSTTPGHFNHRGRSHKKKPFSERFKELFSSLYKDIKNTFRVFWQSVVIITDHLQRHSNDSCFMECVFEDQGFLLNKMVNKTALLERLSETLGENEPWHKVATAGVEICYQMEMAAPSNETCRSGSDKIFRCIFKHIFFNCPNWAQNEYCMSLREFYQKCPNGPPPEINDNHPTAPSLEDDMESSPSTESERYTEPE